MTHHSLLTILSCHGTWLLSIPIEEFTKHFFTVSSFISLIKSQKNSFRSRSNAQTTSKKLLHHYRKQRTSNKKSPCAHYLGAAAWYQIFCEAHTRWRLFSKVFGLFVYKISKWNSIYFQAQFPSYLQIEVNPMNKTVFFCIYLWFSSFIWIFHYSIVVVLFLITLFLCPMLFNQAVFFSLMLPEKRFLLWKIRIHS